MKKILYLFGACTLSFVLQAQSFTWAKGIGGTIYDNCKSIQADALGNIYLTGDFQGTVDFDPGVGIYNLTSAGIYDTYILKLNASGDLIWAKGIGGIYTDEGNSITVDKTGNVYVTGTFQGKADFDPANTTYTLAASSQYQYDAYVLKLDSIGGFAWAKNFGSSGGTKGKSITVDYSGNVYAAGKFYSATDFDPSPATYMLSPIRGLDTYICKLSRSGLFLWAKGIASEDDNPSIALDRFGNLYITGNFNGTIDFDPNAGTSSVTATGAYDNFILKLTVNGSYKWVKTVKASAMYTCHSNAIAIDSVGNIYTTGTFNGSADFDPGPGTYILTPSANNEAFVSKTDSSGVFLWAKKTDGTYSIQPNGLALDVQGSVYSTGFFNGSIDFNPGTGVDQFDSFSGKDLFILKLDKNGAYVWTKSMNGSSANTIAVDASGNLIIAGDYSSKGDFDPTGGTDSLAWNGGTDIFITKLSSSVVSVKEFENSGQAEFSVFPNPAFNEVCFLFDRDEDKNANFELVDLQGCIVDLKTISREKNLYRIDLDHLVDGIYFYKVSTPEGVVKTGKLVITGKTH